MLKRKTFHHPLIVLIATLLLCMLTACAPTITPQPIDTPPAQQMPTSPASLEPSLTGDSLEDQLVHQWASGAESDLEFSYTEMALGFPDAYECVDEYTSWFNPAPDSSPEQYSLRLDFSIPVLSSQVNLYISGNPASPFKIEAADSRSGQMQELDFDLPSSQSACPVSLSIPVQVDFEIDTVMLTFDNAHPAVHIDAVELVGEVQKFADLPVFWRVSIPSDTQSDPDATYPGGMAVDEFGNLFLANGHHGLLHFDIEGNMLRSFPVPSVSNLTDVALSSDQSIVVTDNVYQWFIDLSYEGVQIIAGGEDFGWGSPRQIAVHPLYGSVYVLDEKPDESRIRVYDRGTAGWLFDLPLEPHDAYGYLGLAFDSSGYLYTIEQSSASILKLDPLSGEVLDSIGYVTLNKTSPRDLALDAAGNIYVLLNTSPENAAVYVLDPQGNLLKRFGALTYDGYEWGEGTFWFPLSIAVTADGKYVFVVENDYLTAYWMEPGSE